MKENIIILYPERNTLQANLAIINHIEKSSKNVVLVAAQHLEIDHKVLEDINQVFKYEDFDQAINYIETNFQAENTTMLYFDFMQYYHKAMATTLVDFNKRVFFNCFDFEYAKNKTSFVKDVKKFAKDFSFHLTLNDEFNQIYDKLQIKYHKLSDTTTLDIISYDKLEVKNHEIVWVGEITNELYQFEKFAKAIGFVAETLKSWKYIVHVNNIGTLTDLEKINLNEMLVKNNIIDIVEIHHHSNYDIVIEQQKNAKLYIDTNRSLMSKFFILNAFKNNMLVIYNTWSNFELLPTEDEPVGKYADIANLEQFAENIKTTILNQKITLFDYPSALAKYNEVTMLNNLINLNDVQGSSTTKFSKFYKVK